MAHQIYSDRKKLLFFLSRHQRELNSLPTFHMSDDRNFHRLASGTVCFKPCLAFTPHLSQVPGTAPLSLDDSEWYANSWPRGAALGAADSNLLCIKLTVNHRHKLHSPKLNLFPNQLSLSGILKCL